MVLIRRSIALSCLGLFTLASCAGKGPNAHGFRGTVSPRITTQGESLATIGPRALTSEGLLASMLELSGAQALEEAALDLALDAALRERGLTLSEANIREEATRLRESIGLEAGAGEDRALELLDRVRTQRGLGPSRYDALLRRSAGLRVLSQESVTVDDDLVSREIALASGPRSRVRLLITPTLAQAQAAHTSVVSASDPQDRIARLALLASEQSTDPSAARAGLVDGLSSEDPAIPSAIRTALRSLAPGEVSPVLALGSGFAVVLLEATTPGTPMSSEQAQIRVRSRLERIEMERIARQLLAQESITPLSDSLRWSWERRPR